MYKLIKNNQTGEITTVLRIEDNIYFPLNANDNTDYQTYLAWLAEGNTPIPADEGVA
jgi:hypothetical protein